MDFHDYWQNTGQYQNMVSCIKYSDVYPNSRLFQNQCPQSVPTTYMPHPQTYQSFQYDYVKPGQQNQMEQQNSNQWTYPQSSQNDDFKKACDQLLEPDMDIGDGQQEYPEGGLLSVPTGEQMNQIPIIGNNNNNNNEDQVNPQQSNHGPWAPMGPVDPMQAQVNSEIDKFCIRERNKGYSAKCLGRKKEECKSNVSKAENLSNDARIFAIENEQKERILEYSVDHVLIPFLGDNNCNFDLTSYRNIEAEKEFIQETISRKKAEDKEFQEKVQVNTCGRCINFKVRVFQKTRAAKEKLTVHENDNANRHTIPVWIVKNGERKRVSEKTLATRVHRAKTAFESCESDYKAAAYQYKLQREALKSDLLDRHWNYFAPYIEYILTNSPQEVWQQAESNGTVETLNYVYSLIFKPG
ncbi:CRE-PQN-92 protein [Caenorhabditis remanei]|uniref:CRE-PQN-92 protein n=1 Tax=Caenorhabditis remanei TaxID=31234 RepID=E3LWK8_CAERE|nr:CRE-PQN-92 protein [Caenorhabditis remanei]